MEQLLNFLDGIGQAISTGFQFLIETVEGLAYCVKLTGHFLENLPAYLSWLPSEFYVIALLVFSIAVIYKILGREG